MNFADILNNYIDVLNCTSKELADSSGLSPAAISRYRSGERIPSFNSEQFNSLVLGLTKIAKQNNIKSITTEKITEDFSETFGKNTVDFSIIRKKINKLISRP